MRSCDPGRSTTTSDVSNPLSWAADAHRFINAMPEAALRPILRDFFEETSSVLEFDQGLSRDEAEQQSFGLLLFQAIRYGVGADT